jgi:hypothetical protein
MKTPDALPSASKCALPDGGSGSPVSKLAPFDDTVGISTGRSPSLTSAIRPPAGRPGLAWHELALVTLLLCAAIALRIWRIDLAQVGYDESAAASLVADWELKGRFPLTGIVSSVGIPNPPAWPYVLALALLPADGPYAVVAVGIVFGLLAVVLCWWVGRRWLGPWGGLAAAAFYGGGFWPILLGRTAWQPAFLAVPALLCLDALLMLAVARRPWALVLACAWVALLAQFHYVAASYALLLPLGMWPARRVLRPLHLVAGATAALAGLLPFLLYEFHPKVRFRELGFLLDQAAGGARTDPESLLLLWNLAGNGAVAGLGGPNVSGLREALGRWASAGMIGAFLAAGGLVSAALHWPRGWRGWLIVAWVLLPVAALARHTLGVLFHYLYLDLPGIALAVGALAASAVASCRTAIRVGVASALTLYVTVSAATLWTLLSYVERVDTHLGYGVPLRFSFAAARATHAHLPPGGEVLVGGRPFDVQVLRFAIGYEIPSRTFEDCREVPYVAQGLYLLMSERTPGAAALSEAGAPLLARIERPGDDAYRVYGPIPSGTDLKALDLRPEYASPVCRERRA